MSDKAMPAAAAATREMMRRIEPMLGNRGPTFVAPDAVNAPMIRHWCAAIGDRNPVYVDPHRAAQSMHADLIAPPAMLQVWSMPGYGVPWGADPVFEARAVLDEYGFTSVVATNVEQNYLRPLRIGDRVRLTRVFDALSPEKITTLGSGHFITSRYEYADDRNEPVALMMHRSFKFRPRMEGDQRVAAGGDPRSPVKAPAHAPNNAVLAAGRQLPQLMSGDERAIGLLDASGGFADVRPLPHTVRGRDLAVGTRLAPLEIPITRSFIVAAAIATRDYQEMHHDPDIARARGSRDIFTNILTTTGLVGRLLTDSLGPDAVIRSIGIRLGAPNYPGDTLRLSGEVSALSVEDNRCRTDFIVRGRNAIGEHVSATASVELAH